ncbi:MAG: 4-hydroxy-3-methylbut-2-enyl diphosphate reductase, partial [Firmicutes bacterium]|nr:4-hydroxy-3-methylbut-2-enyl diphosphate reductase [Bacillota bacterium]
MKIDLITSKYNGFCPGVRAAVELAKANASAFSYCLGDISHNQKIVDDLKKAGIVFVDTVDQIITDLSKKNTPPSGQVKAIIRSHGACQNTYSQLNKHGFNIVDATCPKVKKVHDIVSEYQKRDYQIIILGDPTHPETIGTAGWCINPIIIQNETDLSTHFPNHFPNNFQSNPHKTLSQETFYSNPPKTAFSQKNACIVSQTTFSVEKASQFIQKLHKIPYKSLEIFDTICYTTLASQTIAFKMSKASDIMIVVGSQKSSNTNKLFEISQKNCPVSIFISDAFDQKIVNLVTKIKKIKSSPAHSLPKNIKIGLLAGASTPTGLITEVINYMSQNIGDVNVSNEFKDGIEETLMQYKEGKRVKGSVVSADAIGVRVNIGGKLDGIIFKDETAISKEYNPSDFVIGAEIEAIITGKRDDETGCIPLSKKRLDLIKEGDKVVETIRNGEFFEIMCTSVTKGGLRGKLGNYTVFVPQSQIKEKGFVKDLNTLVGKKLRLTALEIDDKGQKIVASQKKILAAEREEKEGIFWSFVKPGVIINGTVKRITNFG